MKTSNNPGIAGVLSRIPGQNQMSEAFITNVFLALSGGFQDAYTYNARDGVFSNAQTGNVVLMSQYLMVGDWINVLRYLLPVFSFAAGVLLAEQWQSRFKYARRLHWRQGIIIIEILILAIVGGMPLHMNLAANCLASFSCAMQVQAFRRVGGLDYASTMCIGNLRSGTAALSMYIRERRPEQLSRAGRYFSIIFFFAVGAGIGGNLSLRYGIHVIWISVGILLVSFLLMSLEHFRRPPTD